MECTAHDTVMLPLVVCVYVSLLTVGVITAPVWLLLLLRNLQQGLCVAITNSAHLITTRLLNIIQ